MVISESNKRAYDAQKDWDKLNTTFLMKLVLFSSWILTTSITWYIALYDKVNIQELKIIFTFIVWFSLITILSWLFRIYSSSIQKVIEASIHNVWWKLLNLKDILSKKDFILDWNSWKEEETKKAIKDYEKWENELRNKHINQWIIWNILFYISVISFCLSCVSILILLINIK